ncbi:uncharacterized protein LOC144351292 [Saccoglossus kowalevskii]
MLRSTYLREQDNYETCIIFTYHHCIMDGTSMMKFSSQLLNILNQLVVDERCFEGEPKLISFPPDRRHLFKEQSWWMNYFTPILNKFLRRYTDENDLVKVFTTENKLIKWFTSEANFGVDELPRTGIIPMSFSKSFTSRLISMCRKNHCTVHGAVTAATAIAAARIIQGGKVRRPQTVMSTLDVNLRRYIVKQEDLLKDEAHFGNRISFLTLSIIVPEDTSSANAFWELATRLTRNIHHRINYKEPITNTVKINEVMEINKKSDNPKNKCECPVAIFNVSNLGYAKALDNCNGEVFRIAELYSARAGYIKGPCFGNNILEIVDRVTISPIS